MTTEGSAKEGLPLCDDPADWPASGKGFLIDGPEGVLEAVLTYSTPPVAGCRIAVVCHPHPLHGGTMTNKVAHTLAKAFDVLGVPTLRFNFRGVGRSTGVFDEGRGEVQDVLAAVGWLRTRFAQAPLWLAGFSFGAFVAHAAHREAGAERLLLVAPPVRMFAFSPTLSVEVPWMVVQGGEDEVVSAESVRHWAERQTHPPRFECLPDASHFFHRRLVPLRALIVRAWG